MPFTRLIRRLRRQPEPVEFTAPLLPEEPFFAIGDIHGCDRALASLLDGIDAHDAGGQSKIVFVGDYVDRGEDSASVLNRVFRMSQQSPDRVICLGGNHEAMLLSFLQDPEGRGARWLQHGGVQTLASYRIPGVAPRLTPDQLREARDRFRDALGAEMISWLRKRPLAWSSGNVTVVHAAADPAKSIADQEDRTLLWGHPAFASQPRTDATWIVHGHTIEPEVKVRGGRISVDTGAFATGRLSAALITQNKVLSLPDGRELPIRQETWRTDPGGKQTGSGNKN